MSVSINIAVEGAEEFAAAMNRLDSAMKKQVQTHLARWAGQVREAC